MADWNQYLTGWNIAALIIAIIGLIWLIYASWFNSKIESIRRWPRTKATVVNAVVSPEQVRGSGTSYLDPRFVTGLIDTRTKYIPEILYTYNVAGKNYESSNFIYGGPKALNALDIKTTMQHIQPNSTIDIYYNPNNPAESYVYNGVKSYTGIWMGIIMLLIAGAIYYYKGYNPSKAKPGLINYEGPTPNLTEMSENGRARNTMSGMNIRDLY